MVPKLAKCEAETAQKTSSFGEIILPLGCDSFGLIRVVITTIATLEFWLEIAVLSE